MHPIVAEWLDRLENEDIPQTTDTLKRVIDDRECFCAMGVLADTLVKHDKAKWVTCSAGLSGQYLSIPGASYYFTTGIPDKTMRELGIGESQVEGDPLHVFVIRANDTTGLPFKEIGRRLREALTK